ncbi:MAG: hypothetical protein ACE5JU_18120, partial [Candidatus Binatia bacterium]
MKIAYLASFFFALILGVASAFALGVEIQYRVPTINTVNTVNTDGSTLTDSAPTRNHYNSGNGGTLLAELPTTLPAGGSTMTTIDLPTGRSPKASPAGDLQGFGTDTPGGKGRPVFHVTSLNNEGPGSLRDALSKGNRYIVFDVAGKIKTSGNSIMVKGAFITVDGCSAPPPGITIRGTRGIKIHGSEGAHDLIIRCLRIRITDTKPGNKDAVEIRKGAHHIVLDHNSFSGASDETVSVRDADTHDITLSWNILASPLRVHSTNLPITKGARKVSVHHNLIADADRRNPWVNA